MNIDLRYERRIAEEERRFQEWKQSPGALFVGQPQPENRGDTSKILGKVTAIFLAIILVVFAGMFAFAFVKVMGFMWGMRAIL